MRMREGKVIMLRAETLDRNIITIVFQLIFSFITLPIRRLSRAVSELPCHQLLVAAQCKLGPHQEASIEVGKAVHLEQRGHRRQGCFLLF